MRWCRAAALVVVFDGVAAFSTLRIGPAFRASIPPRGNVQRPVRAHTAYGASKLQAVAVRESERKSVSVCWM